MYLILKDFSVIVDKNNPKDFTICKDNDCKKQKQLRYNQETKIYRFKKGQKDSLKSVGLECAILAHSMQLIKLDRGI